MVVSLNGSLDLHINPGPNFHVEFGRASALRVVLKCLWKFKSYLKNSGTLKQKVKLRGT